MSIRNTINKINRDLKNYKASLLLHESLLEDIEDNLLPAIISIGSVTTGNLHHGEWYSTTPKLTKSMSSLKKAESESLIDDNNEIMQRLEKQALHRLNVKKTDERLFSMYKYKEYKKRAISAYKNRKIFTIYGSFKQIRTALEHRGWIEKLQPDHLKNLQSLSQHSLLVHSRNGNDYEKMSLSKLVQNYPSFFIWQPKQMVDTYGYLLPYRNRIRCGSNLDYATKIGLLGCTENAHWNTIRDVAEVQCPRFFRLDSNRCKKEFLKEYRLMQCLSLINFIIYITEREKKYELYDSVKGTVSVDDLEFAFDIVEENMKRSCIDDSVENDDTYTTKSETISNEMNSIDSSECEISHKKQSSNDDEMWRLFIINSRKIISKKGVFKIERDFFQHILLERCYLIYENAKKFWPTLHMDGFENLWILKPGYRSRGLGIVILRDFNKITKYALSQVKSKYIVQKYIERPLLIYKTKFDLRQFILVTITETLNIWMYKNCYLRFSSQPFSLNDLSEAVHLTNHSVQKKYRNGNRSARLPMSNMWSLLEFQQYLKHMDCPDIWNSVVYPGMKRNVIGTILASLEEMELVSNSFEMYGCDFILDENFEPILLEINSSPDVSSSTPVTKKLCPTILEDMIKVVIDLPEKKNAPTGDFELIYQIDNYKYHPTGPPLALNGDKININ